MKRVAITGMTASQCSKKANEISLSMAGVLSDVALTTSGGELTIDFISPTAEHEHSALDKYDVILVGVAPVSSLASNYAFSGLHAVYVANELGKLATFVDAPESIKIAHSLSAIQTDSNNLQKALYAKRTGYARVLDDRKYRKQILSACSYLASNWDAPLLYPSLPFDKDGEMLKTAFSHRAETPIGVNFDRAYMHQSGPAAASSSQNETVKRWLVEGSTSKWFSKGEQSLAYPWEKMTSRRRQPDSEVFERIAASVGSMLSPQSDGTCWWSYRYAQTLAAMKPVVTEWRMSNTLGEEWATLPGAIEDMDYKERMVVAVEQFQSYSDALNDVNEELSKLIERLGK